jgi:hypothetical protein
LKILAPVKDKRREVPRNVRCGMYLTPSLKEKEMNTWDMQLSPGGIKLGQ